MTLVRIIEELLPGDFSTWEEDHTTWNGIVKTVDATSTDPRSKSCAWHLFFVAENPDEFAGYVGLSPNEQALREIEAGINQAASALDSLSSSIFHAFDRATLERLQASYEDPGRKVDSPLVTLKLLDQAIPVGVAAALRRLEEIGDEPNKANRKAAVVAEACREIYAARTGFRAPLSARDDPQKADEDPKPALFTRFTTEIFSVFGINCRVDSALRLLRTFSN